MKTYLTLFFGTAFSVLGWTQTVNNFTLGLNNAAAVVNDGGVFFNNESVSTPGCEIPQGSQTHPIYAMAFWYAGIDANGQLKLSAQKYQNLTDQFKGPLSIDGSATSTNSWNNALFPVTKDEILYHQTNFSNLGYVTPQSILNWPAHGDVSLNQDFYLAPFIDIDQNGLYEPSNGDYPCIRGDQAVYVIMNDKGGIHTSSGGDAIGIEMHYLFYEYLTVDDINNTTFVYGKVINRGTQTLNDFKVSAYLDGDVGFYGDDYFGSDSSRNLMYFYNADNYDDPSNGVAGYQLSPPSAGILSLTHDFESIGLVEDQVSTAPAYWNAMNAKSANGMFWTHPNSSNPVNFMYPSDPSNVSQANSEVAHANPPGERKGVATIDFGTLTPNTAVEFDMAVVYSRGGLNNIENAVGIKSVADNVQAFFDSTTQNDCIQTNTAPVSELTPIDFAIYPNPSNGELTLSLGSQFSNADVEIFDISGRSVLETLKLTSPETTIRLIQPSGVYIVHLNLDGQKSIKRILLE